MATNKDYLIYVLDLLRELDGITYKKMMGEYILYYEGTIFGGIYDNRFLVKKTAFSSSLHLKEVEPYQTGKMMLLMDSEDPDEIKEIVINIVNGMRKQ